MTDLIQSIILGLTQGLGEFLPISSSGHLILIPKIFGWKDPGLAFDVALHIGTLFAVLLYFWKDWIKLIKDSVLFKKDRSNFFAAAKSDLLLIIIISTLPGAISGILLEKYAETIFRDPVLIAITLFAGGLILYIAEKYGKKSSSVFNLKKGITVGIAQAFAIIPGISRSGITISAALALGYDRISAARFSFLLSTPIILGAGIKELPKLMGSGLDAGIIAGALTSGISGYFAIKYMIKYLENKSYDIFVIYRFILAIAVLAVFFR